MSKMELDRKKAALLQAISAALEAATEKIKRGELESFIVRLYEGSADGRETHQQAWILHDARGTK